MFISIVVWNFIQHMARKKLDNRPLSRAHPFFSFFELSNLENFQTWLSTFSLFFSKLCSTFVPLKFGISQLLSKEKSSQTGWSAPWFWGDEYRHDWLTIMLIIFFPSLLLVQHTYQFWKYHLVFHKYSKCLIKISTSKYPNKNFQFCLTMWPVFLDLRWSFCEVFSLCMKEALVENLKRRPLSPVWRMCLNCPETEWFGKSCLLVLFEGSSLFLIFWVGQVRKISKLELQLFSKLCWTFVQVKFGIWQILWSEESSQTGWSAPWFLGDQDRHDWMTIMLIIHFQSLLLVQHTYQFWKYQLVFHQYEKCLIKISTSEYPNNVFQFCLMMWPLLFWLVMKLLWGV